MGDACGISVPLMRWFPFQNLSLLRELSTAVWLQGTTGNYRIKNKECHHRLCVGASPFMRNVITVYAYEPGVI